MCALRLVPDDYDAAAAGQTAAKAVSTPAAAAAGVGGAACAGVTTTARAARAIGARNAAAAATTRISGAAARSCRCAARSTVAGIGIRGVTTCCACATAAAGRASGELWLLYLAPPLLPWPAVPLPGTSVPLVVPPAPPPEPPLPPFASPAPPAPPPVAVWVSKTELLPTVPALPSCADSDRTATGAIRRISGQKTAAAAAAAVRRSAAAAASNDLPIDSAGSSRDLKRAAACEFVNSIRAARGYGAAGRGDRTCRGYC